MADSLNISAPDLTKRPPRSPRCRLGGYVILPRLLDKGRAVIAGTNGEFIYDAPIDQHLKEFIGLDFAALREQLAAGKGDGEILEWVNTNANRKRAAWEIEAWSNFMDRRGPSSDAETLQFFTDSVAQISREREDIKTWFDLVDLEDYVSFGGKA
ncbi:MAG TPA: DUF5069 domain-containing protein [Chthoniobacterales bacterium]|jgi:hypothetical protein|nr:DUF5069 domain-containing protein [Chthoniobacterales bacterium]